MIFRLVGVALLTAACGAAAGTTGQEANSQLSFAQLMHATRPGPWAMNNFAAPVNALPPSNVFEGYLQLGPAIADAGFHVLVDHFAGTSSSGRTYLEMPPFDFAFVQSGVELIPIVRGTIQAEQSDFEYILEPGRVWDEPGDQHFTRAAIPFTLEDRNENCMHNGVLTFLFRYDGAVSNVAYEIGSETCAYFQFDAYGYRSARYKRANVKSKDGLIAQYRDEVAQRLPTKAVSELTAAYPGADTSQFGSTSEVAATEMTLFGVVADGINYVAGCGTRFGVYPYCSVLDLPSYSVAKSVAAGLAMMRLSLIYPQVGRAQITDYVPECAKNGSWSGVTIGDALDMVTGHFTSAVSMQDEYSEGIGPFFLAESHSQKITFACNHFPRKSAPGKLWVYHTTDTYIAGTGLNNFYREKVGADADVFRDVLVAPIWAALHLSPSAAVARRTIDTRRQAFMGYGLTLHRDDIAKLAIFINVAHGSVDGRQMIDPVMLGEALRRNSARAAYQASTPEFSYKSGFWAWNAQYALGCRAPTWVPFMLGYGGIVVALFPNGLSYYYFSDGGNFKWQAAAIEANKMRPFCSG